MAASLWPILLLHSIMLPLNLLRLRDALGDAPTLDAGSTGFGSQQFGGR